MTRVHAADHTDFIETCVRLIEPNSTSLERTSIIQSVAYFSAHQWMDVISSVEALSPSDATSYGRQLVVEALRLIVLS